MGLSSNKPSHAHLMTSYLGKAIQVMGVNVSPDLVAGFSPPVVVFFCWRMVQKIHHSLHDARYLCTSKLAQGLRVCFVLEAVNILKVFQMAPHWPT